MKLQGAARRAGSDELEEVRAKSRCVVRGASTDRRRSSDDEHDGRAAAIRSDDCSRSTAAGYGGSVRRVYAPSLMIHCLILPTHFSSTFDFGDDLTVTRDCTELIST